MNDGKRLEGGYYAVGYFDILGQRRKLFQGTELPGNREDELKRVAERVHETAGVVRQFRELFQQCFEASAKVIDEGDDDSASRMVSWGMSDAYVIAVPLADRLTGGSRRRALKGVVRLFHAAASVWLASLAVRIPIRGAVELGWGVPIGENEVYGEALAAAYVMESKFAGGSRILVGRRLVEFLDIVRYGKTPIGKNAADLAEMCRRVIRQDSPSRFVVDGLGLAMKDGSSTQCDVIDMALAFVRGEIDIHKENGDHKLVSRYRPLLHDLEVASSKCRKNQVE